MIILLNKQKINGHFYRKMYKFLTSRVRCEHSLKVNPFIALISVISVGRGED
jgi:hypothetical protein